MFKALDLTINSLGSGSFVVGKKKQKTGSIFFSLFPQGGAWSKAKPLTTVTLFSVLLIIIFGGAHLYKKEGLLRSDFWPFGNSQLSWVDGCFD